VELIMIGYDVDHEAVRVVASRLPMAETAFVAGGHDYFGREAAELDEVAVKEAAANLADQVSGWAVSGMFSVKNPDHELRAAAIIKSISDKPVTMGRDLTGQYDAVRRVATAALNAGLVVIINNLLDAVRRAADQAGFEARLMVVKGDGSLVSEEWARGKPIETVVSWPAASALGVGVLGRGLLQTAEENVWVMDVGGTTTDLAYLKKGRPVISRDGARIGPWSTMTAAVETRTRGLGGDSLVALSSGTAEISLGPRRVLPLCRLAQKWPETLTTLQSQKSGGAPATLGGVFFLPGTAERQGLSPD
jgi:N-methylhydantoinase A/oxoprolinase/acetone carboxylase beta subunit